MDTAVQRHVPHTYMGTFDDVVERFPWNVEINSNYLRASVARHALLGGNLILNDGYLIQNKLAKDALLKGLKSPLYNLMRDGFVRVLSSHEDIMESLYKRAESGVATIKDVIDSPDWELIKPRLEEISRQQQARSLNLGWPRKNMGIGFRETILRCRNQPHENLGLQQVSSTTLERVFDSFEKQLNADCTAARTVWENAAKSVLNEEVSTREARVQINELMGIANEAYHMNFSICLGAEADFDVGVETRQSAAFNELIDEPELLMENLPDVRGIALPDHRAFGNPEKLRNFTVPGEEGFLLKQRYLQALEANLSGPNSETESAYETIRFQYADVIARTFGADINPAKRKFVGSLYVVAGSTIAGMVDPSGGVATAALAFVSDQYLVPSIVKNLSIRNLRTLLENPELFDKDKGLNLKVMPKGSSALRSVVLDKTKSLELSTRIPEFVS